jgi:Holliday junction resolvasome RuvABC DNA-binding subunit
VRALVSLGYSSVDADKAVRAVLDEEAGGDRLDAAALVRKGLSRIAGGRR